jgi:hypothetical protein
MFSKLSPKSKVNLFAPNSHMEPLIEFFEYLVAFAAISTNFNVAKGKINSGITDPNQIFAENYQEVVSAWQGFEARRKTMTYLPYKY